MLHELGRILRTLDGFPKVDGAYRATTAGGGVASVVVLLLMAYMAGTEISEYARYRQEHQFVVDTAVRQAVYINVDVTVAMPCALLRVNVADASGDASNVRSSLRISPVPWAPSSRSNNGESSELLRQGHRDIHVHDLIANAGRRRRQRGSAADVELLHGDAAETACRIAGSVRVNKVSGLLHITASGGGGIGYLSGAFDPRRFLNFTHAIDALSFGPLYPGIANPLDSTLHIAPPAQAASFKYFVSVVRTTYISPAGSRLDTNQYAVNELRRIRDAETLREPGGLIPGIFFDYSFEPIAVEVRETRRPLLVFLARLCAALSGPFVTAGLAHQIVTGFLGRTAAGPLAHH